MNLDKKGQILEVGDWVHFDLKYDGGLIGLISDFDFEGDPIILVHKIHNKKDREWHRYSTRCTKLSENEAMLFILERS